MLGAMTPFHQVPDRLAGAGGNPAGPVLAAHHEREAMQRIARSAGQDCIPFSDGVFE